VFLVDAGPNGEWGIRATITMWRRNYGKPKKKLTQTVEDERYCFVGRIDQSNKKAIPSDEKRNSASYRLVLKMCLDRDRTF
jgi:hypothetical protein